MHLYFYIGLKLYFNSLHLIDAIDLKWLIEIINVQRYSNESYEYYITKY